MFYFPCVSQECPVCGRPLQVREEYLNREVACIHCHGRFLAGLPTDQDGDSLMNRIERLLCVATVADQAISG